MSIHLLMRLSVAWTWWCLELPWLQPSTLVSVTLAKGIRKVNFKSFEPGCSNFYSQNFDSVMHKMLFMTDEYYLRVDWSLSTGFQMRQQLNLAFLQSLHWCLTSHGHDSAGLSTANHWNWRMLAMYFRHNVPKQKLHFKVTTQWAKRGDWIYWILFLHLCQCFCYIGLFLSVLCLNLGQWWCVLGWWCVRSGWRMPNVMQMTLLEQCVISSDAICAWSWVIPLEQCPHTLDRTCVWI